MIRVYLMADHGKGPRCVRAMLRECTNDADEAATWDVPRTPERMTRSTWRRWWLVEAESAEDARLLIADAGRGNLPSFGRIIDQGGQS